MLEFGEHEKELTTEARATALFAATALGALAREERMERRGRRLLEPGHATWAQFRGRLGPADFAELLLEDAAVTQPSAFTLPAGHAPLASLPTALYEHWLAALPGAPLDAPGDAYVTAQAKRLGLPTRMARSDLHKLQAHHTVLELPGTGGQLAHYLATRDGLHRQDVFTLAARSWIDAHLAALVAVELGLTGPAPLRLDPDLRQTRAADTSYDYVIGLERDKGGFFKRADLQEWFPNAEVLLV